MRKLSAALCNKRIRYPNILLSSFLSFNSLSSLVRILLSFFCLIHSLTSYSFSGVGHVIALHNGHNGWPSESELSSLTELIVSAGFITALDV